MQRTILRKFLTRLGDSDLRSCVRVELDVLGILALIVRKVSVDFKQHGRRRRAEEGGKGGGRVVCAFVAPKDRVEESLLLKRPPLGDH